MKKGHIEILSTHNLSVGYNETALFQSLDLTLNTGELVCFMGPNGAGKSTLIRTLSGLQKPLNGRIDVLQPDITTAIISNVNHIIGVVLTDRITAHNMTVNDVVTFGRYPYLDWNIRLRQEDQEMIESALQQVHITHLRKKKLFELSDGQVQLAMIARVLAQNTPVIILDEPTAHLDLNNRVEIMKLLRELAHMLNKAVLLATHDLDLALQTADKIWLTGNDRNIIQGIPEDLVLNGSFDSIFQFKGFDLKTGRVQHAPSRKTSILLEGSGHVFLWTRNALERNGYTVSHDNYQHFIKVIEAHERLYWSLDSQDPVDSIGLLLDTLNSLEAR